MSARNTPSCDRVALCLAASSGSCGGVTRTRGDGGETRGASRAFNVRDLTLGELEHLSREDSRAERRALLEKIRPGCVESLTPTELARADERLMDSAGCAHVIGLLEGKIFDPPAPRRAGRALYRDEGWSDEAPDARALDYAAANAERTSVIQASLEHLAACYAHEKDLRRVARGEEALQSAYFPATRPTLDDKISELESVARELEEWASSASTPRTEVAKVERRVNEALTILRGSFSANPHIRVVFLVETLACSRLMYGPTHFDRIARERGWLELAINDQIAMFEPEAASQLDRELLWSAIVAWDDRSPGKRRGGGAGKWRLLAKLVRQCGFGAITPGSLKSTWSRTRRRVDELSEIQTGFSIYTQLVGPFQE